MSKPAELLRQAQNLAEVAPTWADFSNSLFDPCEGILIRAYPDRAEREQFIHTDEFKQILRLLAESRKRHGLLEGANPTRITEFMVQLSLTSFGDGDTGPAGAFRVDTGHAPSDPAPHN